MRGLKAFSLLIVSFLLFFLAASLVQASLVTINKSGKVILKVLSVEDSIELEIPRREYLAVKDITEETPDPEVKVSLAKIGENVKLLVFSKSGEKSLDVTNYKEEIVEIEERPEIDRLTIGVSGDKITISQKGVVAETDHAINIDPEEATLTLQTPTGYKFLSIFPRQAVESVLRSKIINSIREKDKIILKEDEGELTYEVKGDKVFSLFNIFKYSTPVEVKISASTGEIISIEKPDWLRILGFLFI